MSDMSIAALLGEEPESEKPELYDLALQIVVTEQRASSSWLQRKLGIGYNRAVTLMAALEENGVVSAPNHVGKREIHEADLLGEEPDKPTPQTKKKTGSASGRSNADIVQYLMQPVSITFLSDVLGRDKKTVVKRLAGLTPMGHHRGNIPLYDFRQALEHLVTPRFNAAEAIKKMGTDDLPIGLQKDVWDARLKQQKWMQQAQDLWHTGDVLEVLGGAFQRLKTTTQLWIDQLGETHAMSSEVRKDLTAMVDALQTDLHRSLVEMPAEKVTAPQSGEIEGTDLDV